MRTPLFALLITTASAFSTRAVSDSTGTSCVIFRSVVLAATVNSDNNSGRERSSVSSRGEFMATASKGVLSAAAIASLNPAPVFARGRATLEASYDRYTPRIIAGGAFYASDFRKIIERGDWAAIKAATSEPPKKTKADRSKQDGGIAERAAQAGQFSESRVVTACDLFAAAFSDNSISAKTKKMQAETAKIREVVAGINSLAKEALGEESGGGLFGFGGKKKSASELSAEVKKLYVEGGNAWNQYIFAANEELPLSLAKLPYL